MHESSGVCCLIGPSVESAVFIISLRSTLRYLPGTLPYVIVLSEEYSMREGNARGERQESTPSSQRKGEDKAKGRRVFRLG